MRKTGHLLMWLGFLGGSFYTMRQLDTVEWPAFAAFAVVGAVGVGLLRRSALAGAADAEVVEEDLATLERSLAHIDEYVAGLLERRRKIDPYEVRHLIDEHLAAPLDHFALARESMIHALGMHEYAAVMDPFARGERLIHRAWSASADGYVDEVWQSMEMAHHHLLKADDTLKGYLPQQKNLS